METESDTRLFGVTRPSPDSLEEKVKMPNEESEPEEKYELEMKWDTESDEEELASESESESEQESESEPEPEEESESESESEPESELEPELEEESKSESESEPDTEQTWSWRSKPIEDLMESDFYRYDDDPVPFYFSCSRFEYKNKAKKKLDEETEKAVAEYQERSRNLSPFDAIPVPPKANKCGNNWAKPTDITNDEVHTRLIRLSNLALAKYNARNQGPRYVFEKLVKATSRHIPIRTYYITFEAKDAIHVDLSNCPAIIFQAHVWDRSLSEKRSVLKSCSIKPT